MKSAIRRIRGVLVLLFVGGGWLFLYQQNRKGTEGVRSLCQSNLVQILRATKQYIQDYNEIYPPVNPAHLPLTDPPSSGYANSLQPYLHSLQVMQCDKEPNSVLGETDYSYNTAVAGRNETDFGNASNTVMLGEQDESFGGLSGASGPIVTNRHVEGSNYGFVDGHVKWLESEKAPTASNVAATGHNFTFGS